MAQQSSPPTSFTCQPPQTALTPQVIAQLTQQARVFVPQGSVEEAPTAAGRARTTYADPLHRLGERGVYED